MGGLHSLPALIVYTARTASPILKDRGKPFRIDRYLAPQCEISDELSMNEYAVTKRRPPTRAAGLPNPSFGAFSVASLNCHEHVA